MLFEYLQKYVKVFDENFPIYEFMGVDEDDVIKIIQKCLDSGKPYEPDTENGALY